MGLTEAGAGERKGAGAGDRTGTGVRLGTVEERTTLGAGERRGAGVGVRTGTVAGAREIMGAGERTGRGVGAETVVRTTFGRTGAGTVDRMTVGVGEGDRNGKVPGARETTGAGERRATGVGAGTVERTTAGRTAGGGAVDRTILGAGGVMAVASGGMVKSGMTASCFTTTGVPGGEALKKISAMPCGNRMQPCDAA